MTTGDESQDFPFDGGEARLGRTADNDVVIKDPSSSRSHARVYEEDGGTYVEDLKSANGTKLNGKALKAPALLENGDKISIGDVVLEFIAPANDATVGPSSTVDDGGADEVDEDPNATMLRPPSRPSSAAIRKAPSRPAARRPTPPPEPEEPADEPEDDGEAVGESTRNFDVPPPRALQRRPPAAPARRPSRVAESDEPEPSALSAADRARQRRELNKSATGKAQLLWSDLPLPAKIGVGLVGTALVVGMLGLIAWSVIPRKVHRKSEPMELVANDDPLPDSFGQGEVEFDRPDQKSFTFAYPSPTSIVGVLHYQARACSKDEVTVELNGSALGSVPADTVDVAQRQLEVVLPATVLKPNEPNELVFDNVLNPPGEEEWAIWNLWVEIIPIPQMSAEDAARRAGDDIKRAQVLYDQRAIGAMNLFRSWKTYRDAWLLLEATPERPPELLQMARTRMREIRPELDRKCSAMLVDYQKEMNQRSPNYTGARNVLQNIPTHFEKEHPCYAMSRGLLRELDTLDVVE